MKIGIDARLYGPEGTGIGRYLEKLIGKLEIIDKENEYFIFLRKKNFSFYNPKNPKFKKVLADVHWYTFKEQVLMPTILNKFNLDLVHFPHLNVPLFYSGKFIVTLHDLTKVNFGSKRSSTRLLPVYLFKHTVLRFALNQILRRAKKVMVPSNFVKTKLLKTNKIDEEKVKVVYEAADDFVPNRNIISEGKTKSLLGKFAIREPFILYVGNTYPFKNVEVVLKALLKVDNQIQFVCISRRDRFLENLLLNAESLGIRSRLIATGYVLDEDLKILFEKALCFVFPSLSEGFGLPGLEAMARRCPVIAAEASCLPEVYGEAALYFKPEDSNDLANKINKIFSSESLRNDLKRKGVEQVKKYSWNKTAEDVLKEYHRALK